MLTGMNWFEAMLSPRPHPASIIDFLIGANANTKAPAGPVPGNCPLISRKEQSLWPYPPTLRPASHTSPTTSAHSLGKKRNKNQVQPDGQAVLLISTCGALGLESGGMAAKQARVPHG